MAMTEQVDKFNVNISESVTVRDEGHSVKIIDNVKQDYVVVTYGKELDSLIMVLLYLSNSDHYGLENKINEQKIIK